MPHRADLDAGQRVTTTHKGWKERYRCVGHETVEGPEYGTLQVMSFLERVDETGDS